MIVPLSELNVYDEGEIDCLKIDDKEYHNRIQSMGLKCKMPCRVDGKLFGNYHVSVGQGFTTSLAIRQRDAKNIYIDFNPSV